MIHQPTNIQRGKDNLLPYTPISSTVGAEVNFFSASMPLMFTLISMVQAVTTGDQFQALGRNYHALQTTAEQAETFGATVLVEATLDGTHWFTLDTITTATNKQYVGLFTDIRATVTAWTSGHISVFALSQRA